MASLASQRLHGDQLSWAIYMWGEGGEEEDREAAVQLPPAYFLYLATSVLICTMFLTKDVLSSVTSHPREDKLTAPTFLCWWISKVFF